MRAARRRRAARQLANTALTLRRHLQKTRHHYGKPFAYQLCLGTVYTGPGVMCRVARCHPVSVLSPLTEATWLFPWVVSANTDAQPRPLEVPSPRAHPIAALSI